MSTEYNANHNDWDMDCIKKVKKTYDKLSKDIQL